MVDKAVYSRKTPADDVVKTWQYQIQINGGAANGLMRSSDANIARDLSQMTSSPLDAPQFMYATDGSIAGVKFTGSDDTSLRLYTVWVQT